MARNPPLHIDIPPPTRQGHHLVQKGSHPDSPGYFHPKNEASFSFTTNGSQYVASPCSDIASSPMMTLLPSKMQTPLLPIPLANRDEKRGRNGFDFQLGTKVESPYQSHLNHPFIQLRQQRLQEQQPKPRAQQSYVSKYSSYTGSSQNMIRSNSFNDIKSPTALALSSIEKDKLASQYPPYYTGSSESLVSPPPPYFGPDQRDTFPINQPFTPASFAQGKRNSLPTSESTQSVWSISPVTRAARELKRHSLPATSSASVGLQWPSAMTMTVAAVTRPKQARTVSLQVNPISYGRDMKGPLSASTPTTPTTPTTVFTPRTTRLPESGEFETLYCYRISEEEHCTSQYANVNVSSNPQAIGTSGVKVTERRPTDCNGDRDEKPFPCFWQDAKEHQMHWVFCCLGVMVLGSAICIVMVPGLMAWAAIVPGIAAVVLSAQYTRYRWRRYNHHKQSKQHSMTRQPPQVVSNSTRMAPTALAIDTKRTGSHAHQSSLSSMHTSAGSIGSDSFLGSHEPSPPRNLKSHFQHHYFRPSTPSSSVAGSPPSRFAEWYSPCQHSHQSPLSPSPEYGVSWHGIQSHDRYNSNGSNSFRSPQRLRAMVQRQGSASSIASSETVSSTSTSSEVLSPVSPKGPRIADCHPEHAQGALLNQPLAESSSLAQPEPQPVSPPLPTYAERCKELVVEESGEGLSEKTLALLNVVALPEITPVGDFLSEFAVDFGTTR